MKALALSRKLEVRSLISKLGIELEVDIFEMYVLSTHCVSVLMKTSNRAVVNVNTVSQDGTSGAIPVISMGKPRSIVGLLQSTMLVSRPIFTKYQMECLLPMLRLSNAPVQPCTAH